MKKHVLRAVCLSLVTLFLFVALPAFADEQTTNLESKVIQTFDDPDSQPWFVIGSKFSTAGYPKLAYANTWPTALHGSNKEGADLKALGIAMLFDRMGFNWVDIVPGTKSGEGQDVKYEPIELPLPGRVTALDMWIWSGNYDYYIEAYVRDYKGVIHILNMGSMNHTGWKNFRANVPTNIPQSKKYLPRKESLKLVKFRIWTKPTEIVAAPTVATAPESEKAVYFYFDQIKILTDTFESLFDGDALMDSDTIESIWGNDSGDASSATGTGE